VPSRSTANALGVSGPPRGVGTAGPQAGVRNVHEFSDAHASLDRCEERRVVAAAAPRPAVGYPKAAGVATLPVDSYVSAPSDRENARLIGMQVSGSTTA
jgi:hypothetical protein